MSYRTKFDPPFLLRAGLYINGAEVASADGSTFEALTATNTQLARAHVFCAATPATAAAVALARMRVCAYAFICVRGCLQRRDGCVGHAPPRTDAPPHTTVGDAADG